VKLLVKSANLVMFSFVLPIRNLRSPISSKCKALRWPRWTVSTIRISFPDRLVIFGKNRFEIYIPPVPRATRNKTETINLKNKSRVLDPLFVFFTKLGSFPNIESDLDSEFPNLVPSVDVWAEQTKSMLPPNTTVTTKTMIFFLDSTISQNSNHISQALVLYRTSVQQINRASSDYLECKWCAETAKWQLIGFYMDFRYKNWHIIGQNVEKLYTALNYSSTQRTAINICDCLEIRLSCCTQSPPGPAPHQ